MTSINYDAMFTDAQREVDKLEPGTVFEVRSLFKGTVWNSLQRGERSGFGRFFSSKYQSGALPSIERVKRGKDNHRRYRKL